MKYKAEIFDKAQFLFDVTGYNDHQVHCVIDFDGKVDPAVLEKAAQLLLKAVPILSRVYRNKESASYWEDTDTTQWSTLFALVKNEDDFKRYVYSKTNAERGPQIKFCLLQAEKDSLSITINHMVSDGAGFKQCIYLFAEIYSKLMKDPAYEPDFVIDGDRSFKDVLGNMSFFKRAKLFFSGGKDNNQESHAEFPFDMEGETKPFIIAHRIPAERYLELRSACKKVNVTVNDLLLTAYFRALSKMLGMEGKELDVAFMIDMRRYLADKSFNALSNLSATSILNATVLPGEDFFSTLRKISAEMEKKKSDNLGINTFLKLDLLFKLQPKAGYILLEGGLHNPKIGMTNIGVLDANRLKFADTPVSDAYMCGSIKYRPHFQISATTFKDKMTICMNLYGSEKDRENYEKFLVFFDKELESAETSAKI